MAMTPAANSVVEAVARALERLAARRSAAKRADLILVALSGGADSVALLHAMSEVAPRTGHGLAAAHLNHRLRGAESDRDEAFVRELCGRLGVELVVEQARGLNSGSANLEERCREARWAFLAAAAGGLNASCIATAHHADDQAETVMLRLLRGAGVAGLRAMGEQASLPRGLTVLRPMLRVGRAEIEAYLNSIEARFVTDSSNLDRRILRNRVRLELIPSLERDFAPGLRRRLAGLASEMSELDDYVTQAARTELQARLEAGPAAMKLERFAGLHPALMAALLRAFLEFRIGSLRRITRVHINALKELCMGKSAAGELYLPGGWRVHRQYDRLFVIPAAKADDRSDSVQRPCEYSVELAREGNTAVAEAGFVFASRILSTDAVSFPESLFEAVFDLESAAAGLCVRNFAPGDRVDPLGMDGSRKLQDVFVDRKLERLRRRNYPVVTLKESIAWVPGMVRGRVGLMRPDSGQVMCVNALEMAQLS